MMCINKVRIVKEEAGLVIIEKEDGGFAVIPKSSLEETLRKLGLCLEQ